MPENDDPGPGEAFAGLAWRITQAGKPYPGGLTLRYTASDARLACARCGELPPPVTGWSSDGLTLCQDARHHALTAGPGHQVAVSAWNGAIYAPTMEHEVPSGQ